MMIFLEFISLFTADRRQIKTLSKDFAGWMEEEMVKRGKREIRGEETEGL